MTPEQMLERTQTALLAIIEDPDRDGHQRVHAAGVLVKAINSGKLPKPSSPILTALMKELQQSAR